MTSTYFVPWGSSSGKLLYIQLWYSAFYVHQYKQPCRYESVLDSNFVGLYCIIVLQCGA